MQNICGQMSNCEKGSAAVLASKPHIYDSKLSKLALRALHSAIDPEHAALSERGPGQAGLGLVLRASRQRRDLRSGRPTTEAPSCCASAVSGASHPTNRCPRRPSVRRPRRGRSQAGAPARRRGAPSKSARAWRWHRMPQGAPSARTRRPEAALAVRSAIQRVSCLLPFSCGRTYLKV